MFYEHCCFNKQWTQTDNDLDIQVLMINDGNHSKADCKQGSCENVRSIFLHCLIKKAHGVKAVSLSKGSRCISEDYH